MYNLYRYQITNITHQSLKRVKSQNRVVKLLGQSLTVIGTVAGAVLAHNSFRFYYLLNFYEILLIINPCLHQSSVLRFIYS